MKDSDLKNFIPLGKTFTTLAKQYLGVIAQKLEHTGINRFFYALLIIHYENNKITQQRLSDILKTDKVTTVRVIDYLAKKGLVIRKINIKDRREHLLILTEKGKKLIPDLHKSYMEIEKEALKGLSKKQIQDFQDCLCTVEKNLSGLPSRKVNIKFNSTNKDIK
jgi:DNA-binding MarR family transcriptional regulator